MSRFLSPLLLQEMDDKTFKLLDVFDYESDKARMIIRVPKGFSTDFASVPRLGMIYAMLGNVAHQPAVIHDWLYYAGTTSRAVADAVFLEAMEVIGLNWFQRRMIYLGVRVGGWVAWNGHRKAGHSEADYLGNII